MEAIFVTAVINLGVAIPSSPGFIGTYQWLGVSALALFDVGANEALAFSILMHAVWYVPTLLVGGALLLRRGLHTVQTSGTTVSALGGSRWLMRPRASAAGVDGATSDLRTRLDPRSLASVRTGSVARDVVIAGAVSLVLGVIRLGTPSLWVDEAATARAVDSSLLNLFDGYHGLYYSIETPWTFVAGTSEWALRLPSVFGAMIACALLVVLAHRLFDGWVPLLSGLFLATSPFVVKWSQQARGYTFLLVVSLLATLLLLRALERGSRGAWALYGVGFAAVLVWHPVAGLCAHAGTRGPRRPAA